jgi:formiminotetrahydrofolate cyclodeaminase
MGASLNIMINTRSMKDSAYAAGLRAETESLLDKYCALADRIYSEVAEKLKGKD